jgi:glycosyltransferase involved in cell wall biosynthesis
VNNKLEMNETKTRIICIMMVRNESTNIERSIVSVKDLDGLVLFDTGSTDDTIEKARGLCASFGLPFYLLEGEFEDFSKSRNKLIDYARDLNISEWMILLDANDELQNIPKLREYLPTVKDIDTSPLDKAKAILVNSVIDAKKDLVFGKLNITTLLEELKARAHQHVFGKVNYDEATKFIDEVSSKILEVIASSPTGIDTLARQIEHVTRDVIYLKQKWKIAENNYLEFKNHRCIRSDTTMRYTHIVHECLVESAPQLNKIRANEILDDVVVYQDRLLDTTMSSEKRWIRDKKLLQREYNKKVVDPRIIFYYAQTCKCLGEKELSYKLYEERFNEHSGFQEERYVAAYECGMHLLVSSIEEFKPPTSNGDESLNKKKGKDVDVAFLRKHFDESRRKMFEDGRTWFLRAFEHSNRAEPLLILAKYYAERKDWRNAYLYSSMACKIIEPKDALLWYNSKVYTYDRWHVHSIISYNMKFMTEAIDACQKAIDACSQECDMKNMIFFQQSQSQST